MTSDKKAKENDKSDTVCAKIVTKSHVKEALVSAKWLYQKVIARTHEKDIKVTQKCNKNCYKKAIKKVT